MAAGRATPETIARYVHRVAVSEQSAEEAACIKEEGFAAASERLVENLRQALRRSPRVFAARRRVATQLREQGALAEARELQEELLDAAIEHFGLDAPEPLAMKRELGLTLSAQGELRAAAAVQMAVLDAYVDRYGDRGLETLQARLDLAMTRKREGDLELALELQSSVLGIRAVTLGYSHEDTVAAAGLVNETKLQLSKIKPPSKKNQPECPEDDVGNDDACDDDE